MISRWHRLLLRLWALAFLGSGLASALANAPLPSRSAVHPQFTQANRLYQDQEYEKALEIYQTLAGQVLSREVQFNLGNCYFRLGQTGRACLAYRRALLADPGMVEARQNLRFLRNKLGFLTFESSRLQQAAGRLTTRQWAWIAAFGGWTLVLGLACLLALRLRQIPASVVLALSVSGGMAGAAACGALHLQQRQLNPERLAIVVEDGAVALTGPFPDARPVQSLSPGSEVRIQAVRDGWLFVYIPGDHAGWLEARLTEKLISGQL